MVGAPETFTKADHCYWLTQSTALDIFRAGFELVSMNIVFGAGQVGFLLRACEPSGPRPATRDKPCRKWKRFNGSSANGGLRKNVAQHQGLAAAQRVSRETQAPRLLSPQKPKARDFNDSVPIAPAHNARRTTNHEQTTPIDSHEHSVLGPLHRPVTGLLDRVREVAEPVILLGWRDKDWRKRTREESALKSTRMTRRAAPATTTSGCAAG